MPYIKKEDRKELDEAIESLTQTLTKKVLRDQTAMAGLLNYTVSRLVMGVIMGTGGVRYHKIASITGMLKNVADEFYRRVAAPYEDDQINKNGDILEYSNYDYAPGSSPTQSEESLLVSEVGSYFRGLRRERKLSQKVFAQQIGISVRKLSKFERSTDPDVFVLQRVLRGFGGELVVNACFGEEKHRIL